MKPILCLVGFLLATAATASDYATIQCEGHLRTFYIGKLLNVKSEAGFFYIDFVRYVDSYVSDTNRSDCTYYYASPGGLPFKRDFNVGVIERSGQTTSIVCNVGSVISRFDSEAHLIRDGLKTFYGVHPTSRVDGQVVASSYVQGPQCYSWID